MSFIIIISRHPGHQQGNYAQQFQAFETVVSTLGSQHGASAIKCWWLPRSPLVC